MGIKISTPQQDGERQGAVTPSNESLPGGVNWAPLGPLWLQSGCQLIGKHIALYRLVEKLLCFKSSFFNFQSSFPPLFVIPALKGGIPLFCGYGSWL